VHPEILAKWRAQRASQFVVTQKHPLEPPTHRDLTARPFKPGGGLYEPQAAKPHAKKKRVGGVGVGVGVGVGMGVGPVTTARMRDTLTSLMDQLKKTEGEIEKQSLKLSKGR